MTQIQIRHTNVAAEAQSLMAEGYCPVECSMGTNVVDALLMDHHGPYSHLEGVAVRAYRDHFGARASDPRFVVTGFADEDACFAVASLAGLLPHPSKFNPDHALNPAMKAQWADLTQLAALINRIDTAPIGIALESEPFGDTVLLWGQTGGGNDALAFYAGVDRWRALTIKPPRALLEAAKVQEGERKRKARDVNVEKVGPKVAIITANEWGMDVWYAEFGTAVVWFNPQNANITLGCPNNSTAEALFGPGGLKPFFPRFGEGWGGRESIGGSPRGKKMEYADARQVAAQLAAAVIG